MKEQVLAIVDELKRLKGTGVEHLYVSGEAIRSLKFLKKSEKAEKAEVEEALASIPENIRSASIDDFNKVLAEDPDALKAKIEGKQVPSFAKPPAVSLPEGDKQSRWNALRDLVMGCTECNKHVRAGYKLVFGVGNLDADIFFCGEAPGAEEEEQGEPFVGPAGQLLNKMIKAMGLDRSQVYIGNIMNWRPEMPTRTGNRPPKPEEMAFCMPYLKAQIEIVRPKVIVALGATATKGLYGQESFKALREVKGEWREFDGIPTIATYHPSYLLRNSSHSDKRKAWEDLLKVMGKIGLPISDKQRGFFLK
ncbi:uracil-DNA glycosylase [Puniceicoccaceae bacterium K14]|nr:uracil-DNA glycosylase [Puniceicoccaceae bacterium K14]